MSSKPRIVITGLGLTAPNGNTLAEFRANLLAGKARIAVIDVRHMGRHPAGVCDFDATKVAEAEGNPQRHPRRLHLLSSAPAKP